MYPLQQLQQVKIEELKQELTQSKKELEILKEYYGADELLIETESLLAKEENIASKNVVTCINKIKEFINLNYPITEKINQIKNLMTLTEVYFDQTEIQSVNSALAVQKNKLVELVRGNHINSEEIKNHISKIDLNFFNILKKILGKMNRYLSEKSWTPDYQDYLTSQLELLILFEEKINEKSTEISNCFDQIHLLNESIKAFEVSHQGFVQLENRFRSYKENYQELNNNLFKSETINSSKKEVEEQIEMLNKEFCEFDPIATSLDTLDAGLQALYHKLIELHQLNHNELQKQQDKFISRINDSKRDLTAYAERLSLLKNKCAQNKSQQLQVIKEKIDSLLNDEINQKEDVSSIKKRIDYIADLKQAITEAKPILSEYRGVSLLRCFATLWGGGKVTSEFLVNRLEVQLTNLNDNLSALKPKI